ncbi:MAG: hypothetical protein U0Q12_14390 [Vicinamibacterales bacterium]
MATSDWAVTLGNESAWMILGYFVVFIGGSQIGLHIPALVWSLLRLRRSRFHVRFGGRRASWLRWTAELAYGLANPLVYLLALSPILPEMHYLPMVDRPLSVLAWSALASIWAPRFLWPRPAALTPVRRLALRIGLWLGIAAVCGHALRDVVVMGLPLRLLDDGTAQRAWFGSYVASVSHSMGCRLCCS